MNKEQKATAAGALGATVSGSGAVTAVITTGAVTGLRAASISSRLAVVGKVIGGGMAYGVVVVAAPLTADALVYGFYKLFKNKLIWIGKSIDHFC